MLLASCQQKEQPGMTATEPLAGQWYCQCDVVVGEDVYEDGYGVGDFLLLTYNTAANKAEEMIIDDLGNFWEFKVKVTANQSALTFSAADTQNLVAGYEDLVCQITDGKMIPGGATTPSGQPADYIEFTVEFSDGDYPCIIHGYRYAGFELDD